MSTLQRQRRRAERLDDPRFERLRNPRTRRFLVGGLLVLLAVQIAALIAAGANVGAGSLSPGVAAAVWVGFVLVIIAAFVVVLGALMASTRGVEELSPEVLDERMVGLRGEIYARAYRVLAVLVMAVTALGFLAFIRDWTIPAEVAVGILALLWQLAVITPTLVASFVRKL